MVVEYAAQPLVSTQTASSVDRRRANDQPIGESLVIAFEMIVVDKLPDGVPEVSLRREPRWPLDPVAAAPRSGQRRVGRSGDRRQPSSSRESDEYARPQVRGSAAVFELTRASSKQIRDDSRASRQKALSTVGRLRARIA